MSNIIIEIRTNVKKDGVEYLRSQVPAVEDGVTLEYSKRGAPAKLTFTCIKDRVAGSTDGVKDGLSFPEGAPVIFHYNGKEVFKGYVFEKKRNKEHHIEVTCFDATFYFKNKKNYIFTGLTLDQIVKRVAEDMGRPIGSLSKSNYVIPKLAKQMTSVFDILDCAVALTTIGSGEEFILYDEAGKLYLKSRDEMQLDLYIDKDTFEDFDYSTSIANNTYNRIVVSNSESSDVYVLDDKNSQSKYGVLQLEVDLQNGGNAKEIAKQRLAAHQYVSRSFGVNGHFGDIRVRGGSGVYVDQSMMGDLPKEVKKMWVKSVTHTFSQNDHYMDMTLTDGKGFYSE